jgi:deazaflavin-dependent oxidoreductase (nitroreductase family)
MSIADDIFHTVLRVHERLYVASDGRVGHRLLGVPSLLLRTTGRRSGEIRTNGLVYARDGERYLVVPSNGGARRAPGWFHNLSSNPDVEFQIGRERRPATAAIVGKDDPDFTRLWQAVNDNNGNRYTEYQSRTEREIPVVALTPATGP